MKMKRFFTFALLFVLITVCHAQTTKFAMTLGTDLGLSGKNYKIVTPNVSASYDITPRLSAGVRAEDAITLMKAQGVKSYDQLFTLGGQVAYDVCHFMSIINVQARAIVGHTIGGGHDRGYMYYQGGIYTASAKKDGVRSEIGLGVRYNDYRGDLYHDKAVFFVSYAVVLR